MSQNDMLSRWELKILASVRKEIRSEKKITKDITLNILTTSQLITGLMSRGYLERIVSKSRIRRYSYTEKFAITQEGLTVLEEIDRRNSPWNQSINRTNQTRAIRTSFKNDNRCYGNSI